ncbi:MAG: hypothetical protein E7612_07170 [Ruminococcaceae bacterium]|nr:hypothetical protein [Oscillospiraceae bacterium]
MKKAEFTAAQKNEKLSTATMLRVDPGYVLIFDGLSFDEALSISDLVAREVTPFNRKLPLNKGDSLLLTAEAPELARGCKNG